MIDYFAFGGTALKDVIAYNANQSAQIVAPVAPAKVDRVQAEQFARLLFEGMAGYVNLRAIEEPAPSRGKARVVERWLPIGADLPGAVGDYVEECAASGLAAYLLPHPVREGGGGLKDILAQRVIPIDIDKGDISAKVTAIKASLGEPWLTVQSGGVEHGQSKKHLYYRLTADATPEEFGRVAEVRDAVARQFGADLKVGRNPAQILRVAGSLHAKAAPRLCALDAVNASHSVTPDGLASVLNLSTSTASNVLPFSLDFSRDRPAADMERVLTQPILAEGGSADGLTRFEGVSMALGHILRMMRQGRYTEEQAWNAAREWNIATLVPPWTEERLRGDWERLARIDRETYGPIVLVQPAIPQNATGLQLTDWYARDKFKGSAPERHWLVEGLIPRGTPGVFAAVGDAGKSMLALRLANMVASYAPPETTAQSPAGITDAPRFFGQPVIGRGTAVFLTGEDDADEVHRRLDAIDPSGAWRSPQSRLIVLPLLSAGGAHALIASGPRGPEFTPAWHELRGQLEALPELALVVLDPLTLFVGGDTNDNSMGAALMGEINRLASQTGAAVMLIHHFAKTASTKIVNLSDARNAVLGAAAWVNNARWSLVLWEADQDGAYKALKALGRVHHARQAGVVYYGGLTKGNAPGAKVMRTLVRGTAGVLEDQTEHLAALAPSRGDVDGALFGELCALKRQDPTFAFTQSPSALMEAWGPALRKLDLPITKDGKGKGKHSIVTVFDRLLDSGKLAKTEDRNTKPRYEPVLP